MDSAQSEGSTARRRGEVPLPSTFTASEGNSSLGVGTNPPPGSEIHELAEDDLLCLDRRSSSFRPWHELSAEYSRDGNWRKAMKSIPSFASKAIYKGRMVTPFPEDIPGGSHRTAHDMRSKPLPATIARTHHDGEGRSATQARLSDVHPEFDPVVSEHESPGFGVIHYHVTVGSKTICTVWNALEEAFRISAPKWLGIKTDSSLTGSILKLFVKSDPDGRCVEYTRRLPSVLFEDAINKLNDVRPHPDGSFHDFYVKSVSEDHRGGFLGVVLAGDMSKRTLDAENLSPDNLA